MAAPVLQFKRGLLTNLPGLRAGEPGFTTDSYDLYVGLTSETSTNKFFGSHRYWIKETTSTGSAVNLVEGTSNGSDYISIKSPDSLAGIVTYVLPGTQGNTSTVLTNDGSGNLSWASGSANPVFTGIATFTDTTDNTLGNADTGSVQIDGGLGINKNLTVGANLDVQGYSNFVGVVTFRGGTINLGDNDSDDINVAGEFISNLTPNTDDTYDIGISGKRWRNAHFAGVGTFATGAVIDNLQIGISGTNEIDTSSGNLTLDSAGGQVIIDDNLSVSGVSTFGSDLDINASIDVDGHTELDDLNVSGVSTFASDLDINASIDVDGHTELDNLNVSGISTFASDIDINASIDVDGHTELDDLNVSGISTFGSDLDINASIDISTNLNVTGFSTFASAVDINSDLDVDGRTELDITNISETLNVVGVSTFTGLVDANGGLDVTGHTEIDDVNVSGIATIQNLDVQSDFDIYSETATFHDNVIVEGNLTVNGTETIINTTLTVQDREIILGVGTNGSPNDASATGGGISIASTEGNPLVDFYLVGVHTHPTTYKDIVWIRADDLGVGTTDAWHFNYAVGIGSTQVLDGVRLAVTNTQITDDTLSTPQVNVSGASTIGGLLDVNGGLDVTGQVTLNNNLLVSGVSTFSSDLDINASIDVNGHTELNTLNVSGLSTFASAVDINSDLDVDGVTDLDITIISETLNVSGVSTFASAVDINSDLDVDGHTELDSLNVSETLNVTGISTFSSDLDINASIDVDGHTELDDLNVSGISTFIGAIDADGGANISGGETILSSATVSDLTSGRVVLAGTSGSLEDSSNLTFGAGGLIVGANGINVTGLSTFSTDVTVGGDLTVGGNDIKASDGTTALTLADSTGAVTAASDLTVSGNLYVSGNTTQVNTAALTVEDRTIDLGIVNGATPASATTWDLGVLFNYYTGGAAKKSAVVWEHGDTRFKFASVLGADTNGTDNNTPQLTVTTFAPIEIGALWVTDCAGTSQVISCTGTERFLENITVDAGQF